MKQTGFWRFARKFHHQNNSSKLSKRWLAQLSENSVEGVCGRSLFAKQDVFLSAVFSNKFFFAWSRLFKELQLKGNLINCPQIWTVARLTYQKQKHVCQLSISKYYFSESIFCLITSHFLNPISKMFCKVSLQLNMAKRRICFDLKLSKGDQGTCINFSVHEKFSNSFYFNFLGTIW